MDGVMQFGFQTAGEIRFGRGRAASVIGWLATASTHVLLVHGSRPESARWLMDDLAARHVAFTAVSCSEEPTLARVEEATTLARAAGAGAVVALGGGSVIDLGKAVAALAPSERPAMDHLEIVGRGLPLETRPLPFAALPTTAGTGAEVTKNAVLGLPDHGRKVSLRDPRMLPDLAIVDPGLTDGAPRSVTMASGLDALTQVIEPFCSSRATPLTDALCRDAIPRGLDALRRLAQTDTPAARDDMAYVSLVGGLSLANAGLGLVHGLAGVIGGRTGAPHGEICAALLPHVLEANIAQTPAGTAASEKLLWVRRRIAEAFGSDESAASTSLLAWMHSSGIRTLDDLGLVANEVESIAKDALGASSTAGNPVQFDLGATRSVLERALGVHR